MTEAQLVMISLHLLTGIFGADFWAIDVLAFAGYPGLVTLRVLVVLGWFVHVHARAH